MEPVRQHLAGLEYGYRQHTATLAKHLEQRLRRGTVWKILDEHARWLLPQRQSTNRRKERGVATASDGSMRLPVVGAFS